METAIITKLGKGWKLAFDNGTGMTIIWTNIPEDWDNTEILVERVDGQPVLLKKGEIILKKTAMVKPPIESSYKRKLNNKDSNDYRRNNTFNNNNNMQPNISAKSPYNFIPLNEIIIYPDEQKAFFDKFDLGRNTGYIDLEIKNLTPIFIRGNKENFLLFNGKPILPGSSLRGLIRNILEILSYSKLGFINNSRFFFRSFADSALRLRYEYNSEITKHTKVGILFQKKDKNYILVPSVLIGTISDITKVNDCIYDASTNIWKLYSGKMPGGQTAKRNNYKIEGRLISDKGETEIKWNDDIIKEYEDDINRKGLNVIKELKSKDKYKKYGIPVFYQTDENGNISSFGNTKNYRLPYNRTVRNHLFKCHIQNEFWQNEKNKQIEKLDFSNLIFGKTDENSKEGISLASRVYFNDAICDEQNPYDEKCLLKILTSPKPTSFQLYLEQPSGVATAKKDIKHWNDDDAAIRGYKQYWHKNNGGEFKENQDITQSASHSDEIRPIKSNNIFKGKIRFENLTNKELGALLFALDLPDNCCHKIGMGKPLGLGTIRITSALVLDDREKRYTKLLDDEGNFYLPQKTNSYDFKKSFSDFMLSKIGNGKKNLWEVERLSQLKAMLEYDKNTNASPKWLEETRYMEIKREKDENGNYYTDKNGNRKAKNEFLERNVLDTPKNIKSKF